jgi:hypothetical protein
VTQITANRPGTQTAQGGRANLFVTSNNERLVIVREADPQTSKDGRQQVPRVQSLRGRGPAAWAQYTLCRHLLDQPGLCGGVAAGITQLGDSTSQNLCHDLPRHDCVGRRGR